MRDHTLKDDQRERLSERRIAEAALSLIDEHGVEACTMRRLAAVLETGPMAIYNYFADKEALLEAVTQLVLAEVEAPGEELGWQEVVKRIMRSVRSVGLRHPHVAVLMERYPPRTLDALAFVEAGFRALKAAGFDDDAMAMHYSALAAYSFGTLATEVNNYFSSHPLVRRDAGSLDAASVARVLPTISHIGPALAAQDAQARFEYGMDLLLYGFERRHPVAAATIDAARGGEVHDRVI